MNEQSFVLACICAILAVAVIVNFVVRSKWVKIRLRRTFSDPLADLKELLPGLETLRVQLTELRHPEIGRGYGYTGLMAIVRFFNATSPWHDRCGELVACIKYLQSLNFDGQFCNILRKLDLLRIHLERAGRDPYGWNRTAVGEVVTDEKVFLGNIYGLFTHPVSFWKAQQDEPKGGCGFSGMEKVSPYDVVCGQACEFINSHVSPMVEQIEGLKTACKDMPVPKFILFPHRSRF